MGIGSQICLSKGRHLLLMGVIINNLTRTKGFLKDKKKPGIQKIRVFARSRHQMERGVGGLEGTSLQRHAQR